jgi:hypothetical protein
MNPPLVRAGVRPEQPVTVEIVGVALFAARVLGGHEEAVVVLLHRHHRAEVVVDGEDGIAARVGKLAVHVAHDALAERRERVVLLQGKCRQIKDTSDTRRFKHSPSSGGPFRGGR